MNLYAYVDNDPMNKTDPTGKFGVVGAAIGAAIDAGIEAASQIAGHGEITDVGAIGAAAVEGAVIGAVTGGLGNIAKAGKVAKAVNKVAKKSCCFVAGTQVLTEAGYKNIEDVKLGEKLWAKNVETGEQDWKPVTYIFVEPDRGIYEIKLIGSDGFEQKIQATDDHPFYVMGDGWKTTIDLAVGDYIETDGGGAMMVTSVIDEKRQDLTYNFTVADFHTYYVTKRNVLVHNCNKKAGMKKQGRELKNKSRNKGNFKSNNNRRSEKAAKKHTPSKKHTKMTKKKRNLDKNK